MIKERIIFKLGDTPTWQVQKKVYLFFWSDVGEAHSDIFSAGTALRKLRIQGYA